MVRHVLMTGGTGAIGPYAAAEMLGAGRVERLSLMVRGREAPARFSELMSDFEAAGGIDLRDRVRLVRGDFEQSDLGLGDAVKELRDVDVILHCGAETRFRAGREVLERVNVQGTAHMAALAKQLDGLKRFVLSSTTCVAGSRRGRIAEIAHREAGTFVNAYEESKWKAECIALESGLPVRIVRLSTAIGERDTGRFRKAGAFHHALQWIYRGLVPMAPADAAARVDFISIDKAALALGRAVTSSDGDGGIWQVAAGEDAPTAGELTEFITGRFWSQSRAWRDRQIAPPVLTDRATFELFRKTIETSGDVLFRQVLESLTSFLPGLLYPKVYETARATAGCGAMTEDWRMLLGRVIDHGLATAWGRMKPEEARVV